MSGWVARGWRVGAPKPFSMFHRLAVPISFPGGGGGSPGGGPPPPKPPPPPPLKSDDSPAPPLLKPVGAALAPAPDMNFCESCCASAIAAARASTGCSAGGPSEKPKPAAGASEKRLRRLGGSSPALLSRSRDRERSRSRLRLLRSSSRPRSPRSDMAESCARQQPPRQLEAAAVSAPRTRSIARCARATDRQTTAAEGENEPPESCGVYPLRGTASTRVVASHIAPFWRRPIICHLGAPRLRTAVSQQWPHRVNP